MNCKNKMVYSLLCHFILLFSVFSFIQGLLPFSANRIIVIGIFLCLIVLALSNLTTRDLLYYVAVGITFVHTSFVTNQLAQNTSDFVYYAISVVWLVLMSKQYFKEGLISAFQENMTVVKCSIVVISLITGISFFFPSSFQIVWEGVNSYVGFVGIPHTIASSLCLVMAMVTFVALRKRFSYLVSTLLLLLQYVIFMTGARVFAVTSTLIIMLYINNSEKCARKRFIKFFGFAFIIFFLFFNSSMRSKLVSVLVDMSGNSTSTADNFTSGRLGIWKCCLSEFSSGTLVTKLLGTGFDYVYEITQSAFGISIWAHNDFINLLLCTGILGVGIYSISLIRCIRGVMMRLGNIFSREFIYVLILWMYMLFSAVMNGLYTYQHLFLSFLILVLCHNRYSADDAIIEN